jgi:excisionase family DNA binding protein
MNELLTSSEVAELLAVDTATVTRWLQSGRLPRPVVSRKRLRRWRRADIVALKQQTAETVEALDALVALREAEPLSDEVRHLVDLAIDAMRDTHLEAKLRHDAARVAFRFFALNEYTGRVQPGKARRFFNRVLPVFEKLARHRDAATELRLSLDRIERGSGKD